MNLVLRLTSNNFQYATLVLDTPTYPSLEADIPSEQSAISGGFTNKLYGRTSSLSSMSEPLHFQFPPSLDFRESSRSSTLSLMITAATDYLSIYGGISNETLCENNGKAMLFPSPCYKSRISLPLAPLLIKHRDAASPGLRWGAACHAALNVVIHPMPSLL